MQVAGDKRAGACKSWQRGVWLCVALATLAAAGAARAEDGWVVGAQDFPAALTWGQQRGVSVQAQNTGGTTWDAYYGLLGVSGAAGASGRAPRAGDELLPYGMQAVDRWGVTRTPERGMVPVVAPGGSKQFAFTVTAPAITTLAYPAPAQQDTAGVTTSLECKWALANAGLPVVGDAAGGDVVVSRFPDIGPGTTGEWARFYAEECAGRVPAIVQGYGDGTYRPRVSVSRDQMAVFIARAMKLELLPWQGTFADVGADQWAAQYIEALARAGVAEGYPGGVYRPGLVCTRDQMAVFVARGMAGGDGGVPSGPAQATFPDVPTGYWAYRYVEYVAAEGVVQGYPDGLYRPAEQCTRDQMSVFVYRAFIRLRAAAVVLAGPAVTSVDPSAAGYYGWSSASAGRDVGPGYAYVSFDAMRLGEELAAGPNGEWDVTFELRRADSPEDPATGDYAAGVSLTAARIAEAKAAAATSGDPYLTVSWQIPEGLATGDYLLVVSVADETGASHEVARRPAFAITHPEALILYDASGDFGWLGLIYAQQLANLLGHFRCSYQVKPMESYAAGDVEGHTITFYIGSVYDNPLPEAFLSAVMTTERPICWLKYNIWQLAWAQQAEFRARFGFDFIQLDSSGYQTINYRGTEFTKYPDDVELGLVSVADPSLASVLADACRSPQQGGGCTPYVVRGRNLWYVADIPFTYLSEEDRYVVFADLLHYMLNLHHPVAHRAIIRIEDVDPTAEPDRLERIADYLYGEGVPFAVSVVTVYADPLGLYNHGVPEWVPMANDAEFTAALQYMVSKGGSIVLHGYTHQYDGLPNPDTGVTGDDYEFLRVQRQPDGSLVYTAVPEDSPEWVNGRLALARAQLAVAGLSEVAFEAAHYGASALDYQVFAAQFPATIQRALYFTEYPAAMAEFARQHARAARARPPDRRLAGASDGPLLFGGQFFPYVIERDVYGQKVLPENLGNVQPDPNQYGVRLPADIVRGAAKNLVVEDGWASAYFHPFLDLSYLQQLVTGIKALGYIYVPVSAELR
jgi:uncharacterized protein YdaL